jgi:hypothetical protein
VDLNTPNDAPADPLPLDETLDQIVSAKTGTAASAVSAQPHATQLTLVMVGAAGILAGIAFVFAFGWIRGEAPLQTASAASRATTAATAPATKPASPLVVEAGSAPTWSGARTATWAPDGSRTIAFELPATHDVTVWMSRARPVLVARCLSRRTEVFVMLGTSANYEEDSFKRTVRLQWDDGPEAVQQWQASESAQELFAPDGAAFIGQLAQASRLRFGFTPFNAQPVTVEFVVQGFDQLAGLVAGTCGRKR